MKANRFGIILIICLLALASIGACTVKDGRMQINDSKALQTEAPQASPNELEELVTDFFRCIDEERYDELAKLVAPEERGGYETVAELPEGDRTGVRNISSASVKGMSPYELTDSMVFAKSLEKYIGIDGARAAFKVKLDMSVYDENGAYADETGESEQIVLLVKNEEKWFVGFWCLANE